MRVSHRLGHGIGLRREHYAHLLEHGPGEVPWFEVISEDLFGDGGRPWAVAERVRRDVPVVLHGTALDIGNADDLSVRYLDDLERVIERIEPAWVSDHLSWGAAGSVHSHELLPLPYCEATLARVAERVDRVQHRLQRVLLLENPSAYLAFRESTMTEWEFLRELVRRTGAGLLLDVNNVYVSSQNLGFDPATYLDGIPRDAVGQFHLAGHTRYPDFVMDTHVGPVPDAVMALYRHSVSRFGDAPALVEWDTDVPAFAVVAREAARAAGIAADVIGEAPTTRRGAAALPQHGHA